MLENISTGIGVISGLMILVCFSLIWVNCRFTSELLATEHVTIQGVVYDEVGNAYNHKSGRFTLKEWRR